MNAGHNQYAPMTGLRALKSVSLTKSLRYMARNMMSITKCWLPPAPAGIYSAIAGLVHAGDEVIYFEPSFDSYAPIVRLQGATPVAIKLTVPDFAINWDEVRAAITPRTRMIIINTPHNPSGRIIRQRP